MSFALVLIFQENVRYPFRIRSSIYGKRGSNQLHLHALYDLCNKKYTDIRIEKTMVSNESRALVQMLGNIDSPAKTIILADRGYNSLSRGVRCIRKKILSDIKSFPQDPCLISWIWKKMENRQFIL